MTKGLVSAMLLGSMLWPAAGFAQQAGGIAGVVRDASGAVLPGVTVEAASPALIEKVRSAVTDGEGRYNIVDLRPGTYVVTFGLTGFSTVKREDIVLTAGFTATVNAEMPVGSLEETLTVTGASPLVDTQNARQQKVVARDLLDALPTSSMTLANLAALTPGLAGNVNVGGATGVYASSSALAAVMHGKRGAKVSFDGFRVSNMVGIGNTGYVVNPAAMEEWTVETGGGSAESSASGAAMNMIPKEGGNSFSGSVSGLYTNDSLQSDNLTDELRARGLTTVNKALNVHSFDATIGGPIRKDRLWFFGAFRKAGNENQIAGQFFNLTQGAPIYTPDLSRPSVTNEYLWDYAVRLTFQATPKNKVSFFADFQNNCTCRYAAAGFVAPEAVPRMHFNPQGVFMATWSSPRTNKLLLEAGAGFVLSHWPNFRQPEVGFDDISIIDRAVGFRYNAATSVTPSFAYGDPHDSDRLIQRFALSYVTGSHVFKTGITVDEGISNIWNEINGDVDYELLRGVPVAINQFATPYLQKDRLKADLAIFAQDQWSFRRLTINAGLRFEYFNGYAPAQSQPAGRFVPARDLPAVDCIPCWTDLNPRLGASYDVFGDGRTAVKLSVGRYLGVHSIDITSINNPLVTSVNSVNRTWNDTNTDFVPDCDLTNPAANGECGAISDQNFGRLNPNATRYADDAIRGFGNRDFLWDIATEVQQQLGSHVSLTAGYYRNWYGNFLVTDNLEVTPADYDQYCVTAPADARLPGGGGYEMCGLYDVRPGKFGQVRNLVTQASHFGDQKQVSDFFNVSVNTRFGRNIQFGGGVDTGRTVNDNCFVVDSPQQLLQCRVVTPFSAQTQVKLFGGYTLPGDVVVSGMFQNISGPAVLASYAAANAVIAPSLGRNLAACGTRVPCTSTATVPLVEPQTMFEGDRTQLDLRFSKIFPVGSRMRLRANVDVYNVLNASSILLVNTTYGSAWLRPIGGPNTGGAILGGRLVEFGGQLTF